MRRIPPRIVTAAQWAGGIAISLLTLYLALVNVTLVEVKDAFTGADWRFVGLALASVAANTGAKVIRWKAIVGDPGKDINLGKFGLALLAGQTLNTLYPARAGDLARAYALGGMGAGRSYTLGTLVLEKLVDTLCYASLFPWLLAVAPLPDWLGRPILGVSTLAVAFSLALGITYLRGGWLWQVVERMVKRLPARLRLPLLGRMQAALAGVSSLRSWRALAAVLLWSVVIWGTAVFNNQLILWALGIHLPLSASILVLVVLQAGISFPAVPGKVGVFEVACILALAVFGIGESAAFSFGLLLHAVVLVPSTFIGLACLWVLGVSRGRLHEPG